jgi:hypothetical protein
VLLRRNLGVQLQDVQNLAQLHHDRNQRCAEKGAEKPLGFCPSKAPLPRKNPQEVQFCARSALEGHRDAPGETPPPGSAPPAAAARAAAFRAKICASICAAAAGSAVTVCAVNRG